MAHPLDLIYPGRDTAELVKTLSDDWVIVGPIRAAHHLSSVWHQLEPTALKKDMPDHYQLAGVNVFGPNYPDHPWTKWAMANFENYSWMYYYAQDMCDEYLKRFGTKAAQPVQHGIKQMLSVLESAPDSLPDGEWFEPTFAQSMVEWQ
jgi:hypothetical protein